MNDNAWRQRRVLVTGARGFIASHLCQRLTGAGAVVHGVSRRPPVSGATGIHWLQADISDGSATRAVFDRVRPELVFHLAGHVVGAQQIEHVQPTFLMNLASTVHVLTAAVAAAPCRVVLSGSMQEPHVGDPSAVPPSPYAASKWACSGYARMFHALYDLPVAIARPFMVYGPMQWDMTKLLPYVIVSLLRGESPRVSSGTRELDWVYVDDVVEGLLVVGASGCTDARPIDLGTGRLTSVRTIIGRVADLVQSGATATYGAVADRPFERPHAAQAEETRKLIGWAAATPLEEGLARTVAWYRAQVLSGVV
jgi:UDP-glucose 4-epimerase